MPGGGKMARVALVTGGSRGIGAATAYAFAAQSANVLLSYLRIPSETYGVSKEEAEKAERESMMKELRESDEGKLTMTEDKRPKGQGII